MPEIRWVTPIYHPNISEIGMVCLGGYGTHWVPSVQLDELCVMLWDMARYHNYDIRSPYNRDAALWVANQTTFLFPTDPRRFATCGPRSGESVQPADGAGRPLRTGAKRNEQVLESVVLQEPTCRLRSRGFASSISRYGRVFNNSRTTGPRTARIGQRSARRKKRESLSAKLLRAGTTLPNESWPGQRADPNLDELEILRAGAGGSAAGRARRGLPGDILFIE